MEIILKKLFENLEILEIIFFGNPRNHCFLLTMLLRLSILILSMQHKPGPLLTRLCFPRLRVELCLRLGLLLGPRSDLNISIIPRIIIIGSGGGLCPSASLCGLRRRLLLIMQIELLLLLLLLGHLKLIPIVVCVLDVLLDLLLLFAVQVLATTELVVDQPSITLHLRLTIFPRKLLDQLLLILLDILALLVDELSRLRLKRTPL
jgi:hypothetical protein